MNERRRTEGRKLSSSSKKRKLEFIEEQSTQRIEEDSRLKSFIDFLKDKHSKAKENNSLFSATEIYDYINKHELTPAEIFVRNPSDSNKNIFHYLALASNDENLKNLFIKLLSKKEHAEFVNDPVTRQLGKKSQELTPLQYAAFYQNYAYALLIIEHVFKENVAATIKELIQWTQEEINKRWALPQKVDGLLLALAPLAFNALLFAAPILYVALQCTDADLCALWLSNLSNVTLDRLNYELITYMKEKNTSKNGDNALLCSISTAMSEAYIEKVVKFLLQHPLKFFNFSNIFNQNIFHKIFLSSYPLLRNKLFDTVFDTLMETLGSAQIEKFLLQRSQPGYTPLASALKPINLRQSPQKGAENYDLLILLIQKILNHFPQLCKSTLDNQDNTLLMLVLTLSSSGALHQSSNRRPVSSSVTQIHKQLIPLLLPLSDLQQIKAQGKTAVAIAQEKNIDLEKYKKLPVPTPRPLEIEEKKARTRNIEDLQTSPQEALAAAKKHIEMLEDQNAMQKREIEELEDSLEIQKKEHNTLMEEQAKKFKTEIDSVTAERDFYKRKFEDLEKELENVTVENKRQKTETLQISPDEISQRNETSHIVLEPENKIEYPFEEIFHPAVEQEASSFSNDLRLKAKQPVPEEVLLNTLSKEEPTIAVEDLTIEKHIHENPSNLDISPLITSSPYAGTTPYSLTLFSLGNTLKSTKNPSIPLPSKSEVKKKACIEVEPNEKIQLNTFNPTIPMAEIQGLLASSQGQYSVAQTTTKNIRSNLPKSLTTSNKRISRQKKSVLSEEAMHEIGRWGETYAFYFLQHHYSSKAKYSELLNVETETGFQLITNDSKREAFIDVCWHNKNLQPDQKDSFEHVDMKITKKPRPATEGKPSEERIRHLEVKTTTAKNKNFATFSPEECKYMLMFEKDYRVLRVSQAGTPNASIEKIKENPWDTLKEKILNGEAKLSLKVKI